MSSNASPEKVETAGKVLAKIAAYDPMFPNVNDSMILAWAGQLTIVNVPEDVALEAVDRMFTAGVGNEFFRPGVTVFFAACREAMRDRIIAKREHVEKQQELSGPPKMTLREWEQHSGQKFPRVDVVKAIPEPERPRLGAEGSGHVCAVPKAIPKRSTWRCEGCGQPWRERDGKWVLTDRV